MRYAIMPGTLLLGLVLASAASADVTIKMKETDGVGEKKPRTSTCTVSFNASCMATHWEGADAERERVIFRGDKDLMWLVNDSKKSYQQIDKTFADQVAAQMAEVNAQMKARLDELPPEQRVQAEQMMKQYGGAMGGAANAVKLDHRKTTETRTINGHACSKYDTYWGDDLTSHAWVAPYSAMNLTPGDAAVFEKMAEFVTKMSGSLAKVQTKDFIPMHELGGIPLLTQQVDDGKVTSETLVESVSRAPIPPGTFDLPQGYKAEPMPKLAQKK